VQKEIEKENEGKKIYFSFIEVNQDLEKKGLTRGRYLKVKFETTEFLIPEKDFISEVKKIKGREIVTKDGVSNVGKSGDFKSSLLISDLDYTPIIKFLSRKMREHNVILDDVKKLYICSDHHLLLELPWEKLLLNNNQNQLVVREVMGTVTERQAARNTTDNKLLIITSYAYKGIGHSLDEGPEKGLTGEVWHILLNCLLVNECRTRMNNIMWNRHTSLRCLKQISFKEYSFLHFIMHGCHDGGIYLSQDSANRAKSPLHLTTDELLERVGDSRFKLVFFSICYSAGGLKNSKPNLCFELIKRGKSLYSIGYFGKSGNNSALEFSKLFYRHLLDSDNINIENAYETSLKEYFSSGYASQYFPYLYKIYN